MAPSDTIEIDVKNLSFFYKNHKIALDNLSLSIYKNSITSLIGPSGCGKTTFLRCCNRMHDLYPHHEYQGEIYFRGENILGENVDLINLRSAIGMVFQSPTPFPMSIFDNIAYGLRLAGIKKHKDLDVKVEKALRQAALWDEVKDKLRDRAAALSGGQQQRLVIARALAVEPEVLLFDEPTSALDPISTAKIEELLLTLKKEITIIIVTHSMKQAQRISDWSAFFYLGKLIEFGPTQKLFTAPEQTFTSDYINGKFG